MGDVGDGDRHLVPTVGAAGEDGVVVVAGACGVHRDARDVAEVQAPGLGQRLLDARPHVGRLPLHGGRERARQVVTGDDRLDVHIHVVGRAQPLVDGDHAGLPAGRVGEDPGPHEIAVPHPQPPRAAVVRQHEEVPPDALVEGRDGPEGVQAPVDAYEGGRGAGDDGLHPGHLAGPVMGRREGHTHGVTVHGLADAAPGHRERALRRLDLGHAGPGHPDGADEGAPVLGPGLGRPAPVGALPALGHGNPSFKQSGPRSARAAPVALVRSYPIWGAGGYTLR